jgi:glycosyltransferase involved in cell wall biosynthesis
MPAPRRILFLVSGPDEVSCRFRVLQYIPYLQRMGIQVEVADLHVSGAARWNILRSAAGYDSVCVHRAFLSPLEQRRLCRVAHGYIFDFDDAIMFRDSSHRRFDSWQRRWRFRRMVAGARRVIAGNSYLAAWASRYSERVTVIPTSIDLSAYPERRAEPGRAPVIGWIGTRINLMYLQTVVPALTRLARKRPDVTLKVVSDDFFDVAGIPVTNKRWSLADEVDDVTSFHVGIMPLPDDPWTRGKCAVKILQYFAAAVPVVCSPVGANLEVVEHGRSGYFAATEDEWVARLDELLGDRQRRRQFGRAGRDTVHRTYAIESTVDQFVKALVD